MNRAVLDAVIRHVLNEVAKDRHAVTCHAANRAVQRSIKLGDLIQAAKDGTLKWISHWVDYAHEEVKLKVEFRGDAPERRLRAVVAVSSDLETVTLVTVMAVGEEDETP